MADTVSDTIDIEAPAEDVFAVAVDFDSYPRWNRSVKEVRVEEADEQGRGTRVWYRVDARVREVTYTLVYDYSLAPGSFSWELESGDLEALSGSYAFDEFDDVTEVTYEVTIEPGFPVPGFIKRQAARQITSSALRELKSRVEGPGS